MSYISMGATTANPSVMTMQNAMNAATNALGLAQNSVVADGIIGPKTSTLAINILVAGGLTPAQAMAQASVAALAKAAAITFVTSIANQVAAKHAPSVAATPVYQPATVYYSSIQPVAPDGSAAAQAAAPAAPPAAPPAGANSTILGIPRNTAIIAGVAIAGLLALLVTVRKTAPAPKAAP